MLDFVQAASCRPYIFVARTIPHWVTAHMEVSKFLGHLDLGIIEHTWRRFVRAPQYVISMGTAFAIRAKKCCVGD